MNELSDKMSLARRTSIGVLGSLALHACFVAFVLVRGLVPDVPFEVVQPVEIRFGTSEAVEVVALASDAPPPPPNPTTSPPSGTGGEGGSDGGVRGGDAGVGDGGLRDAEMDAVADGEILADAEVDGGVDADVSDAGDAGSGDAGVPSRVVASSATEGRLRLPPGGAVALRFDLGLVRDSPLAPGVDELLRTNPDFQRVIGGSGMEPLRDLDQLLLASPVPYDRSRYVYVGRSRHDTAWARERVDAIAAAHGESAAWTTTAGFPSAPWKDADYADGIAHRSVLLLDEQHFVLCRDEDVGDALAWLATVAARTDGAEGPAAVIGLGRGELLGLQIDGARRYVRGRVEIVPSTLRVSLSTAEEGIALRLRGDYPSADEAAAGTAHWSDFRDQGVAQLRGSLFGAGVAALLADVTFTTDDDALRAQSDLTMRQAVSLLQFAQAGMAEVYRQLAAAQRNSEPPP